MRFTLPLLLTISSLILALITPANAQWAPGGAVLSGAGGGGYQQICPDGLGGAFVGWHGGVFGFDSEQNIYCQRVLTNGTIAPGFAANGLRVCAAPAYQYMAQALPDGSGGSFLIWQDFRTFGTPVGDDLYANRILANGQIAPGWPADGAAVCSGPGTRDFPAGVADGAGGLFVFWYDERAGTADVFVNHLTATGQLAPGWPAGGKPLVALPQSRHFDTAVPDGQGGVLVSWLHVLPDLTRGVYVLRLGADGTPSPGWSPEGVIAATGRIPRGLAPDGAGGALIGLATPTPDGFDDQNYYLQHLTASGGIAPGWAPGGNPICTAANIRFNLQVISDGQGGAILQWQDSRVAASYELLYASRMRGDGTRPPGWPADGLRVTTLNSFQGVSSMVADGSGGAYFAFSSTTVNTTSFIQHLSSTGSAASGWPATGLELGIKAQVPKLATDGAGGAIAAWYRNGSAEVFAQRYVFDGIVAAQLSLASSEVRNNRVALVWQGHGAAALNALVYRREQVGAWKRIGSAERDGPDRIRFADASVIAGTRYGYRLGYIEEGVERFSQEIWVDVPLAVLALEGLRPNPAVEQLNVSFSLPRNEAATIELLDVSGRKVIEREVGSLGAGRHVVRLDRGERLSPGVYWLRLRQGDGQLLSRAVVMR